MNMRARLRAIDATGALPERDTADPHLHGKPTDHRMPAKPTPPVVVVVNEEWPLCETFNHAPATVRTNVGHGPDRNLCDQCADAFASGQPKRELIPGLRYLSQRRKRGTA